LAVHRQIARRSGYSLLNSSPLLSFSAFAFAAAASLGGHMPGQAFKLFQVCDEKKFRICLDVFRLVGVSIKTPIYDTKLAYTVRHEINNKDISDI